MEPLKKNPVVTIQKNARMFLQRRRDAKARMKFEKEFAKIEKKDRLEWAGKMFLHPNFSLFYENGIGAFLKVLDEIND